MHTPLMVGDDVERHYRANWIEPLADALDGAMGLLAIDAPAQVADPGGTVPTRADDERPASSAGPLADWAGGTGVKTLVVVFADIVNSTRLMRKLGREKADDLRGRHFDCARRHIERHGGHCVKTMGDGVMAVFWAARNAVEFALDFQADTRKEEIRIRVGINRGEVTVAPDDLHDANTVNLASRVMNHAHFGGIRVTSESREQLANDAGEGRSAYDWKHYPRVAVKDFPTQALWGVQRARPERGQGVVRGGADKLING